ncbi:hypothetical protein Lal_00014320 [Lupinus albus]|nr:hypothetical protein Lal_00014320 [Lupinus albus]
MKQPFPFGFSSTATEVLSGVDLTGKTMIVTGGASGIGIETVRSLAAAGASVTIAARRTDMAEEVARMLREETRNGQIDVRPLDLSNLNSVKRFVETWERPVHALINNAGVMALPELQRSAEGYEMQFATKLSWALRLDARSASSPCQGWKCARRFGEFDGQPDHWASDGIVSNALNPGAIATNLQRHTGGLRTPEEFRKTPEQGAATSVLLARPPGSKVSVDATSMTARKRRSFRNGPPDG